MPITTQAPTTTTAAPIHLSARGQLKDYCLRRLGAPVIEINVDDQQVEDRIQDALEIMQEYHYDAVERTLARVIITGSTLRLLEPVGNSFTQNEVILGLSSGAAAFFFEVVPAVVPNADIPLAPIAYVPADPSFFYVYKTTAGVTTGPFLPGETVQGQSSGVTGTVAPNGYVVGNWDQQFITIPDNVMGVSNVWPIGPGTSGLNSRNIFDVVYQFRLNDLYNLMSADMVYFAQVKGYLEMLDMLFPGDRTFRFNRKSEKLYIDCEWYTTLLPGCYIVIELFTFLDPEVVTKMYNDYFLKKYATALIKRQWGNNAKKFDGVQLPGGVTLNGQKIYDEAIAEIEKLEDEMKNSFEEPSAMFVG
jgi:hypothetical protein